MNIVAKLPNSHRENLRMNLGFFLWSFDTSISRSTIQQKLYKRGEAFGISGVEVDGMKTNKEVAVKDKDSDTKRQAMEEVTRSNRCCTGNGKGQVAPY